MLYIFVHVHFLMNRIQSEIFYFLSEGKHTTCCTDDGQLVASDLNNPSCFPIEIPPNDPVFVQAGKECLNLQRTDTDRSQNCQRTYGYAEQVRKKNVLVLTNH